MSTRKILAPLLLLFALALIGNQEEVKNPT
jgi:hypothetical protein